MVKFGTEAVLAMLPDVVSRMQDGCTVCWHKGHEPEPTGAFEGLVMEQHRANFKLWHEEDKARDPRQATRRWPA